LLSFLQTGIIRSWKGWRNHESEERIDDVIYFGFVKDDSPIRDAFIRYAEGIYRFPVTNMLYRPGFQMLAMISLAVCILRSKAKSNIIAMIPV